MPEVSLQRPGVDAISGQLVTASVSEHVRMRLDAKIGGNASAFHHAAESRRCERCARSDVNTKGEPSLSR